MPDIEDIYGEAMREAYASAPNDEIILHTLELRHQATGPVTAIRIVADTGEHHPEIDDEAFGLYLTLEDDAPVDSGDSVFFQSCMIDMNIPEQREGSLPSIEIQIDNVTRTMMTHLDNVVAAGAILEVTYREYVNSDRTNPQFILPGLTIREVRSNLTRVIATAQFSDLINKSFPRKVYRPDEFRGLSGAS